LINFANPAGMLTEALGRIARIDRAVGICDAPSSMQRVAAAVLGVPRNEVFLDYFGLNHLGWVRSVQHKGKDFLPELLEMARTAGSLPGLPIEAGLITTLGMIPNEYLYYYYYSKDAVRHILEAEESRGEQVAALNTQLFAELNTLLSSGEVDRITRMQACYQEYMTARGKSYMVKETGRKLSLEDFIPGLSDALIGEGYAGVALDLIEGLTGNTPVQMILNLPGKGSIDGMEPQDVVEIPALVSRAGVHPLTVGEIPPACLGLMKQVKTYERMTIEAAVEHSYAKALQALTIHPLVMDRRLAGEILEEYYRLHVAYFPVLK
jgi:6-phospho-beta-glucosidase